MAGPQDLTDVVFRIVDQSRYTEVYEVKLQYTKVEPCIKYLEIYIFQVLDLLYANFHTDEPMSKTLKIFDGEYDIDIMCI